MVYDGVRFHGTPMKVKITSNIIGYGPMPEPTDDAEQRLTITAVGRVWLSRYSYGDGTKYILQEQRRLRYTAEVTQVLLEALGRYFGNNPIIGLATDVGDWSMELTNREGDRFKYHGSLVTDSSGLSNFIRLALGLSTLWIFDGGTEE